MKIYICNGCKNVTPCCTVELRGTVPCSCAYGKPAYSWEHVYSTDQENVKEKPPVGIAPRSKHNQKRSREILDAMGERRTRMKMVKTWCAKQAKWYQFWLPRSGPVGGFIMAFCAYIFGVCLYLFGKLLLY
jgi:hypothetical protein